MLKIKESDLWWSNKPYTFLYQSKPPVIVNCECAFIIAWADSCSNYTIVLSRDYPYLPSCLLLSTSGIVSSTIKYHKYYNLWFQYHYHCAECRSLVFPESLTARNECQEGKCSQALTHLNLNIAAQNTSASPPALIIWKETWHSGLDLTLNSRIFSFKSRVINYWQEKEAFKYLSSTHLFIISANFLVYHVFLVSVTI